MPSHGWSLRPRGLSETRNAVCHVVMPLLHGKGCRDRDASDAAEGTGQAAIIIRRDLGSFVPSWITQAWQPRIPTTPPKQGLSLVEVGENLSENLCTKNSAQTCEECPCTYS